MKEYSVDTKGVCSRKIDFSIEDGKLHNVKYYGGCPGNLSAIGKLLEGMEADKVVALLKGNTCGNKPTSCTDQLAKAIEQVM